MFGLNLNPYNNYSKEDFYVIIFKSKDSDYNSLKSMYKINACTCDEHLENAVRQ